MKKIVGVLKILVRNIIAVLAWCLYKVIYRIHSKGRKNIPKEGPVLICSNHISYVDPPLIYLTAGRYVRFVGKDDFKKNFIAYHFGLLFGIIFIKRNTQDITAMKEIIKTLRNNGAIGIFPEGTRNGFEKNNGKVKNGAAYIALKTGAKIVPAGVIGTGKLFTKNTVIYGEPLDFSEYIQPNSKKIDKEIEELVSEKIKSEIIQLTKTKI